MAHNPIQLLNNEGYQWYAHNNCHTRGYAWADSVLYKDESLAVFFRNCTSVNRLIEQLKKISGLFSIVIELDDCIIAAVDRTATFPLYYSFEPSGNILLTDDAGIITKKKLNKFQVAEFLATGHTSENETLLENVYTLKAGTLIEIKNKRITVTGYYNYSVITPAPTDYRALTEQAAECFESVFKRFFLSVQRNTLCIPLSGGLDSRLIALMAKKYASGEILCYTYGRKKNNSEAAISRRVASQLGLRWIMVEYDEQRIKNYLTDPLFISYYNYAAGYTSMFFMQDYFAVKALKEEYGIPENSVFIPGHSGDFLGGSQLRKYGVKKNYSNAELAAKIYSDKYNLLNPGTAHRIRALKRIYEQLLAYPPGTLPYSAYEDRDLKEKLSKFIVRSCAVFPFFGFKLMLPFYDLTLLEFFRTLPYEFKIRNVLYHHVLKEHFFRPASIIFPSDRTWSSNDYFLQNLKNLIRRGLPAILLQKNLYRHDWHFYAEITRYMSEDMMASGIRPCLPRNNYNSTIVQWYIAQLKRNPAIKT